MRRATHLRSLVVAAGMLVLAASRAPAETFLVMQSQLGDYIGQGATVRLTAADIEITAVGSLDYVVVNVGFHGFEWSLDFAGPRGIPLVPGPYEKAHRAPFQSPTMPGMSVSGQGRGCSRVDGRFTVLDIAYDGDGNLARFAAEFEQHCDGSSATLYGIVSFQTDLPVPRLPDEPVVDPALTYLLMDGDPGEFISGGRRLRFSAGEGSLSVIRIPGGLRALVTDASATLDWDFTLAAPLGREIGGGLYLGATRYPFQEPDEPGLSVSGNGHGCNEVAGRFIVHYVDFGSGNAVARLAADLEQHCEGGGPALRAAIRVNSTLPPGFCPGDCNGDRAVTVDELLLGVNALLGDSTAPCAAFDGNGDGHVGIDVLVRTVSAALAGCIGPLAE